MRRLLTWTAILIALAAAAGGIFVLWFNTEWSSEPNPAISQTMRADPMASYQPPNARLISKLEMPGSSRTDRSVATILRKFAVPRREAIAAFRQTVRAARSAEWHLSASPTGAGGDVLDRRVAGKTTLPQFRLQVILRQPAGPRDGTANDELEITILMTSA